jgi:hypothetical protein
MSSFGKVVGSILLAALGLVGLLMSLCGGLFTLGGLLQHNMYGVLAFSIPSLVVGLLLGWIAFRGLRGKSDEPPKN